MSINKNSLGELKKVNLYEQVIDSLLNYIIVNDLKSGDKLPTENELKDIFGISRNTIREALKSLQLIGIIESKQNSGMVIKEFSVYDLTKFVPYSLQVQDNYDLAQVCEAREWFELSILPIIIEKRTEEDLENLENIILQIEVFLDDTKKMFELDYKFHHALVECCKNPFIIDMSYVLEKFFTLSVDYNLDIESFYKQPHRSTNEEHKLIYKCIADKNLPALQRIFKKHLSILTHISNSSQI